LYELRLLTQSERAAAAELILSHRLDADEAREVARDIKEFSRLRTLPAGFPTIPATPCLSVLETRPAKNRLAGSFPLNRRCDLLTLRLPGNKSSSC